MNSIWGIPKGKGWSLQHKSEEALGEVCCALSCLFLWMLSSSSQKPWPAGHADVCCTTGAAPIAGGFTPGTFTSQIPAGFREPRLLVVTDPRADYQPLIEASYANLPTMLRVTQILLCSVCTLLPRQQQKGASSVCLMW